MRCIQLSMRLAEDLEDAVLEMRKALRSEADALGRYGHPELSADVHGEEVHCDVLQHDGAREEELRSIGICFVEVLGDLSRIRDCDARLPSSGDPNDLYLDELVRLSVILGRVQKTIYT